MPRAERHRTRLSQGACLGPARLAGPTRAYSFFSQAPPVTTAARPSLESFTLVKVSFLPSSFHLYVAFWSSPLPANGPSSSENSISSLVTVYERFILRSRWCLALNFPLWMHVPDDSAPWEIFLGKLI